jgi:hypothetical protein
MKPTTTAYIKNKAFQAVIGKERLHLTSRQWMQLQLVVEHRQMKRLAQYVLDNARITANSHDRSNWHINTQVMQLSQLELSSSNLAMLSNDGLKKTVQQIFGEKGSKTK